MSQYYYLYEGEVQGPFSLQDFYLMIEQGIIGLATQVNRGGGEDWRPLKQYPELRAKSVATMTARQNQPARTGLGVGRISIEEPQRSGIGFGGVVLAILVAAGIIFAVLAVHSSIQESERVQRDMYRALRP